MGWPCIADQPAPHEPVSLTPTQADLDAASALVDFLQAHYGARIDDALLAQATQQEAAWLQPYLGQTVSILKISAAAKLLAELQAAVQPALPVYTRPVYVVPNPSVTRSRRRAGVPWSWLLAGGLVVVGLVAVAKKAR